MVLGGISPGGQTAFDRRLLEVAGLGHQVGDGIDSGVEVVLEGVEVTVVSVGNLGWNIAFGDAIDVIGGHVERINYRIQGVIDTLDDLTEVALMFAGIRAGRQLAVNSRFSQQVGIGDQGFDSIGHSRYRHHQAARLFAAHVDVKGQVSHGELACIFHRLNRFAAQLPQYIATGQPAYDRYGCQYQYADGQEKPSGALLHLGGFCGAPLPNFDIVLAVLLEGIVNLGYAVLIGQ